MMDSFGSMIKPTSPIYKIWKTRKENVLYCKWLSEPINLVGVKLENKINQTKKMSVISSNELIIVSSIMKPKN